MSLPIVTAILAGVILLLACALAHLLLTQKVRRERAKLALESQHSRRQLQLLAADRDALAGAVIATLLQVGKARVQVSKTNLERAKKYGLLPAVDGKAKGSVVVEIKEREADG